MWTCPSSPTPRMSVGFLKPIMTLPSARSTAASSSSSAAVAQGDTIWSSRSVSRRSGAPAYCPTVSTGGFASGACGSLHAPSRTSSAPMKRPNLLRDDRSGFRPGAGGANRAWDTPVEKQNVRAGPTRHNIPSRGKAQTARCEGPSWLIQPWPGPRILRGLGDGSPCPVPVPSRPSMVGLHPDADVPSCQRRLSPPPPHRNTALPGGPASPRNLPRRGAGSGPHGLGRPVVGGARLPQLLAVRHPCPRLRAAPLRGLRA